jgi:hypothetical protein
MLGYPPTPGPIILITFELNPVIANKEVSCVASSAFVFTIFQNSGLRLAKGQNLEILFLDCFHGVAAKSEKFRA